jgi:hypothetical protein
MGRDYGDYFRGLYERVDTAVQVPFRDVALDGGEPKLNSCHDNVNCWLKSHSETRAVRRWLFWKPDETGRCTFMAHSVLDENGQLVDITPLDPNTPRDGLLFLEHLGTEEDFSAMKTQCSQVLYPPLTEAEWHPSQFAPLEDAMISNCGDRDSAWD